MSLSYDYGTEEIHLHCASCAFLNSLKFGHIVPPELVLLVVTVHVLCLEDGRCTRNPKLQVYNRHCVIFYLLVNCHSGSVLKCRLFNTLNVLIVKTSYECVVLGIS